MRFKTMWETRVVGTSAALLYFLTSVVLTIYSLFDSFISNCFIVQTPALSDVFFAALASNMSRIEVLI